MIHKHPRVSDLRMTPAEVSDRLLGTRVKREVEFFDNQNDEWLTSREAAAYLKISEACLRNLCSNGQIPYYKLERRNRYRLKDLEDLLLQTKRGGSHVN